MQVRVSVCVFLWFGRELFKNKKNSTTLQVFLGDKTQIAKRCIFGVMENGKQLTFYHAWHPSSPMCLFWWLLGVLRDCATVAG